MMRTVFAIIIFGFACCAQVLASTDLGVWTVDSLTRVFRTQPARPLVEPKLAVARGEWESFQVVLTGAPEDLRGARVVAAPLTGPGGALRLVVRGHGSHG